MVVSCSELGGLPGMGTVSFWKLCVQRSSSVKASWCTGFVVFCVSAVRTLSYTQTARQSQGLRVSQSVRPDEGLLFHLAAFLLVMFHTCNQALLFSSY